MTSATSCISFVSQVAARPIACGKTVAYPARATPCSASFHQSYAGMPRRSIAGAPFIICETFSSSVMRETRSSTRASIGRLGFLYEGRDWVWAVEITTRSAKTGSSSRQNFQDLQDLQDFILLILKIL